MLKFAKHIAATATTREILGLCNLFAGGCLSLASMLTGNGVYMVAGSVLIAVGIVQTN